MIKVMQVNKVEQHMRFILRLFKSLSRLIRHFFNLRLKVIFLIFSINVFFLSVPSTWCCPVNNDAVNEGIGEHLCLGSYMVDILSLVTVLAVAWDSLFFSSFRLVSVLKVILEIFQIHNNLESGEKTVWKHHSCKITSQISLGMLTRAWQMFG